MESFPERRQEQSLDTGLKKTPLSKIVLGKEMLFIWFEIHIKFFC